MTILQFMPPKLSAAPSSVASRSDFMSAYATETMDMTRALLGGTTAMREAGTTYLPKFPNESEDRWKRRLEQSTLYPAYAYTVSTLASKPFSEKLTPSDKMDTRIAALLDDIDSEGRNLHVFAHGVFEVTLGKGFGGILVDYPDATTVTANAAGVRTLKAEREANLRPYFVHIHPEQILGWRWERAGGRRRLTMLRILEMFEAPLGEWATTYLYRVRVFEPGKWRLFSQKTAGGVYELESEGTTTTRDIPFVPLYGRRADFMRPELAMRELAHLNIKHWQSQSDQDNLLHVARVPILAVVGGDDIEIEIGTGKSVNLPPGASMQFVEHTGAAIGSGRLSLEDLKEEMRQVGASLLVLQPGKITATQVQNEATPATCELQRMALDFEDSLATALQFAAEFMRIDDGGSVKLFHEFAAGSRSEAEAALIFQAVDTQVLSRESAFEEISKRKIIDPNRKWAVESQRLESQGPPGGVQNGDAGDIGAAEAG